MMTQGIQNFLNRRFGIFIHWGVYSTLGGRYQGKTMPFIGEWAQSCFRIPNREYEELAAAFNPVGFDASRWIASIAAAGAKYIVFTAKHHDGFAMYRSHVDSYNIADHSRFGRDPLCELADACQKHGIGLGIYYSQNLDWHDPDGRDPGDALGKNCNAMSWGNDWDYPDRKNKHFERYFRHKCLPQVRELLTNYGPVCEFWCDCEWGMTDFESLELRGLIHELQPNCVINSRIGNGRGDFESLGDNQNMHGASLVPVESPITLNDTWGYKFDDHNWKSAQHIAERLASLAGRNANLLLNIGPTGKGRFPLETVRILEDLAAWSLRHPGVIANTLPNPFPSEFPWGYCTRCGNQLNFFVRDWQNKLEIPGVTGEIIRASVPYEWRKVLTLLPGSRPNDPVLPVITVEFAAPPEIDRCLQLYGDEMALLPGSGRLILGDAETVCDERKHVTVAAQVRTGSSHMRYNLDGTVADWHNRSDRIVWELRVPSPGRYLVLLNTIQSGYDVPWAGGRTVEIVWEPTGETLTAKLENPKMLLSPCYASGVVILGEIELARGEGELSCRTVVFDRTPASFTMTLSCLTLQKIS